MDLRGWLKALIIGLVEMLVIRQAPTVDEIARRLEGGRLAVRDAGAGDRAGHTPRPEVDHHATRLRAMGTHLRKASSYRTSRATRGNGSRMLKSGGHTRGGKTPRPMSAKTVRNIAGVISSVFGRAIKLSGD